MFLLDFMKRVVHIIDGINSVVGKIGMWIIVPLTGLVFFEVVLRYAFNSPTTWSFETTSFLGGAFFMIVAGYVTLKDKHVNIDIFYSKLSPKTQAFLDIVTYSICYCLFAAVLLKVGSKFAYKSFVSQEYSWSLWQPLLYPIKTIVPLGAFLFLLQGIAVILRRIIFIVNEERV